jgi:hypothetical protein
MLVEGSLASSLAWSCLRVRSTIARTERSALAAAAPVPVADADDDSL